MKIKIEQGRIEIFDHIYPVYCDAVKQSLFENKKIYFSKYLQNLFFGHFNEVSPTI